MAEIWLRNKYGGWFKVDEDKYRATKTNEDLKQYQTAKQKHEADSLNNPLPKTRPLEDIKQDEANRKTDILDLKDRKRYRFTSNVVGVYAFAGKGTSREFRDAQKYASRYGGKKEDWIHCAGFAKVSNGREELDIEVHWVQHEKGNMREAFIKYKRGGY